MRTQLCLILLVCSASFTNILAQKEKIDDGYRGGHVEGIKTLSKALNFIAFGDWGRSGEYYQTAVAEQMAKAAYDVDPAFFLVTGDNFYPNGVESTQDELWKYSYVDVYKQSSLQMPWYVVLGNHDYRGNPEAEIEYSKISRKWHMPARYYAKTFNINDDSSQQVLLLVIDSSPFIKKYYEEDVYKTAVATQDTAAQKIWLEQQLANKNKNIKWVIVSGHHPLYTGGSRQDKEETVGFRGSFKPLFDKYNVDFYICGHEHSLQYIKPEGKTHYFISGAGSEATMAKTYTEIGKFGEGTGGFMTFALQKNKALVQIINSTGKIMYSEEIGK